MVQLDFSKVFDQLFHDLPFEEVEGYNLGRRTLSEGGFLKSLCQEGERFHMVSCVS